MEKKAAAHRRAAFKPHPRGLPEKQHALLSCFSFVGAKAGEAQTVAEPLDGWTLGRYRELAREHSVWLALGGFQESSASADEPRIYARHAPGAKALPAPALRAADLGAAIGGAAADIGAAVGALGAARI